MSHPSAEETSAFLGQFMSGGPPQSPHQSAGMQQQATPGTSILGLLQSSAEMARGPDPAFHYPPPVTSGGMGSFSSPSLSAGEAVGGYPPALSGLLSPPPPSSYPQNMSIPSPSAMPPPPSHGSIPAPFPFPDATNRPSSHSPILQPSAHVTEEHASLHQSSRSDTTEQPSLSEMLFGGSFSHNGGDTGAPSTSSELQMQSKLSDQSERRADGETREDKGGNGTYLVKIVERYNSLDKSQRQPVEATPITIYKRDPFYEQGSQIATNKNFMCYTVQNTILRVIHIETGERHLIRHGEPIVDAQFQSANSEMMAAVSNKRVTIWKLSELSDRKLTDELVATLTSETEIGFTRVAWSAREQMVVIATDRNHAVLWTFGDLVSKEGTKSMTLTGDLGPLYCRKIDTEGKVTSIAMSPDCSRIAVGDDKGVVTLCNANNGSRLMTFPPFEGLPCVVKDQVIHSVAFSSNATMIIGGTENKELRTWDLRARKCTGMVVIQNPQPQYLLARITSDRKFLVVADALNGVCYVLRINSEYKLDYVTEFDLAQPVLSFSLVVVTEPQPEIQTYCVQSKAIQRYHISPAVCLPSDGELPPKPERNLPTRIIEASSEEEDEEEKEEENCQEEKAAGQNSEAANGTKEPTESKPTEGIEEAENQGDIVQEASRPYTPEMRSPSTKNLAEEASEGNPEDERKEEDMEQSLAADPGLLSPASFTGEGDSRETSNSSSAAEVDTSQRKQALEPLLISEDSPDEQDKKDRIQPAKSPEKKETTKRGRRDQQQETHPGTRGVSRAEFKQLEQSLTKSMERSMERTVEKMFKRMEKERKEREKAERERLERLLQVVSTSINQQITKSLEGIVKKEVQNAVSAPLSRSLQQMAENQKREFTAIAQSSVSSLQGDMQKSLDSSAKRLIATETSSAVRKHYQNNLVPAFERACQNMVQQMDVAFRAALEESMRAKRTESEASAVQSMSSAAESLQRVCSSMVSTIQQLPSSPVAAPLQPSSTPQISSPRAQGQKPLLQDPAIIAMDGSAVEAMARNSHALSSPMHTPSAGYPVRPPSSNSNSMQLTMPQPPSSASTRPTNSIIFSAAEQGSYNDAFCMALSAQNLHGLVQLLQRCDPHAVLATPLRQTVILSLIQQLAFDLSTDVELKLNWLRECLYAVQVDHSDIRKNVATVMNQLILNLSPLMEAPRYAHLQPMVRQLLQLVHSYIIMAGQQQQPR